MATCLKEDTGPIGSRAGDPGWGPGEMGGEAELEGTAGKPNGWCHQEIGALGVYSQILPLRSAAKSAFPLPALPPPLPLLFSLFV